MKNFILLFTVCVWISCAAEIHEVFSIQEVKKWTDTADENTLVVFDMDYTLVMLENPIFHRPVFKKYREWIIELEKSLTPHEDAIYSCVFMSYCPLRTVEQEIPAFIKSLQERDLNMIVLTASSVGQIGDIPSIEDWRHKELTLLGIDFSNSFSSNSPTIFDSLLPERGCYPTFKNGILLTNGEANTKGTVLLAFLEEIGWKPSQVIFLDDRRAQVDSMEQTISPLGIHHIGIHYRGADQAPMVDVLEEDLKQAWLNVIEKAKAVANQSQ